MYQNDSHVPPQAPDAERALLGCILKSGSMDNVVSILPDSNAFYAHKHRLVYRAMQRLAERSEPTDITMVIPELGDDLDKIGGRVYLVELIEPVALTTNAPVYAKKILERYDRRRVIEICNEMASAAYADDVPTAKLLDKLGESVDTVQTKGRAADGFELLSKSGDQVLQLIDDFQTGEYDKYCVRTGFHDLDRVMLGIPHGELCTIAGRTGSGKTQLALQISQRVAHRGDSVAILSLEMSTTSLALRILCAEAGIDSTKVRRKNGLNDEELQKLHRASVKLAKLGVYINPNAGTTHQQLLAHVRRLKKKDPKLTLVIVDYLQLMVSTKKGSREREVADLSRSMKLLAMSVKGIAVIQLSQLNREADKQDENGRFPKPKLRHLRESGSIEQDSGLVMFLHRTPRDGGGEHHWVIVAKDREGSPGSDVELAFNFGQFAEIYRGLN